MLQTKFMLFAVVALLAVGCAVAIIGGQDAEHEQFPYYAQMEVYKLHREGFLLLSVTRKTWTKCGGSVLSNQWILTAAQCLDGSDGVEVNLGAMRLFDKKEKGRQIIDVTKRDYVIYPSYKTDKPFVGDIALVRLPSPVKFTDYVQPITLSTEPITADANVIALGYGLVSFNVYPQNLQFSNMKTIGLQECIKNTYNVTLKNGFVCAKGAETSLCVGDVGAPLVSADTGNLVGVAIYIGGDCELNRPEGFTGIIPYIKWIEGVTGGDIRKN